MSREQIEQSIKNILDTCKMIETFRHIRSTPSNAFVNALTADLPKHEALYAKSIVMLKDLVKSTRAALETDRQNFTKNETVLARNEEGVALLKEEITWSTTKQINLEAEQGSLRAKIQEVTQQQAILEAELVGKRHAKEALIDQMTPKQVSFVLQKAIKDHNPEIINLLKDKDFDPNFMNAQKESLLYTAANEHNNEIVEIALKKGGNPYIASIADKTVMDIAHDQHFDDVVLLIETWSIFDMP